MNSDVFPPHLFYESFCVPCQAQWIKGTPSGVILIPGKVHPNRFKAADANIPDNRGSRKNILWKLHYYCHWSVQIYHLPGVFGPSHEEELTRRDDPDALLPRNTETLVTYDSQI